MRKIYSLSIIIGLLTWACSSDLPGDSGLTPDTAQGEANNEDITYNMSVRISAVPNPNGRADGDGWEYENGSPSENAVNEVMFFFFDNDDNVVGARPGGDITGGFNPGFSVTGVDSKNGTTENVEKEITINNLSLGFDQGRKPTKMVTVINPSSEFKTKEIKSLSDLRGISLNFLKDQNDNSLTNENFVMSTSAYLTGQEEDRELINFTPLSEGNIVSTGNPDPIDVYVERVVARLDIAVKAQKVTGKENVYDTGITYEPVDDAAAKKKVYVKFLGWAVTSSPQQSRLCKHLEKSWADDALKRGESSWNHTVYCRSFWAINPESVSYDWFTFSDIMETDATKRKDGCFSIGTSTAYMQENANPYSAAPVKASNPENPTKVIFAAQLIDEDGKEITVAEYDSKYYTIDGLKNLIANSLDLYTPAEDIKEAEILSKYRKVKSTDLKFETSYQHENEYGPEAEGTYYVYFVLDRGKTQDGNEAKWYHYKDLSETPDESKALDDEAIKAYIDSMTYPAMVWENGYSYYYFDIPHFSGGGDAPGTYGVVRNHIYNATVTSIKSLGTPVYAPDEVIYPEHPVTGGNQLEVTVKTMQWRLVNQNLQLAW